MAMTDRQQRFVAEYLIDPNQKQAAIKAGYSEKTAEQIGYQLLQKTSVAEAITKAQKRREKRTDITADKVLQELASIGFDDEKERTSDRLKALELIGKHLTMFTDRVDLKGDVNAAITFKFERLDGDDLMG